MKKSKIFYVLGAILFGAVLVFNAYKLYTIFKDSRSSVNELNYTNQSLVDYFANIKSNEYITSATMPAKKTYITDLVDSLSFTFQYNYSSNKNIPIDEEHRVIATIYTSYNKEPNGYNNPIIWEKEYLLKDTIKRAGITSSNINVTERINLDLSIYNLAATKFKESLSVPTTSYLEVAMIVKIAGKSDEYLVNETKTVLAKVPLTEEVFSVEALQDTSDAKAVPSLTTPLVAVDSQQASIYFLLAVGSLIFIAFMIKGMFKSNDEETFVSIVDKLKKEFNDIVVETDNMVDTKELKPIVITTFDELLNLANSLEMPIILYEEHNVACFYIVKGDIIYSFLVKKDKKEIKGTK